MCSDSLSNIYSDILSGISSDTLSAILIYIRRFFVIKVRQKPLRSSACMRLQLRWRRKEEEEDAKDEERTVGVELT